MNVTFTYTSAMQKYWKHCLHLWNVRNSRTSKHRNKYQQKKNYIHFFIVNRRHRFYGVLPFYDNLIKIISADVVGYCPCSVKSLQASRLLLHVTLNTRHHSSLLFFSSKVFAFLFLRLPVYLSTLLAGYDVSGGECE